jgi:hypothetical protein
VMKNEITLHDRPHSSVVEDVEDTLRMGVGERQQVVSLHLNRHAASLGPRRSDRGLEIVEEDSIDHARDSSDCSHRHGDIPRGDPFCQTEQKRCDKRG